MVGIYKVANGLQFTGIVAETLEKAEEYLGNKYGKEQLQYNGQIDENNYPMYKKVFKPFYNKEAFKILPLTVI